MKNNAENIPESVFEGMEHSKFSGLDRSGQDTVLLYFTPEEYDELHDTMQNIKALSPHQEKSGREMRKQELLAAFDRKNKQPRGSLLPFQTSYMVGSAAAVALLFFLGWLAHSILAKSNPSAGLPIASGDTVYVVKNISSDPIVRRDTVYILKTGDNSAEKQDRYREKYGNNNTDIPSGNTNTLSINQLDSMPNQPKKNNLKNDSLIGKYSFVSI